ncbi:ImmA/IrrE family metallo-endopeptidase [Helicobacter pylori]
MILKKNKQKLKPFDLKDPYEIHEYTKSMDIQTLPFDIFSLVNTIEEIDYYEDYLDKGVMFVIKYQQENKTFKIVSNSCNCLAHRRFSLASALGHVLLNRDKLINEGLEIKEFTSFSDDKKVCRFAFDLMVSKDHLDHLVKNGMNKISKLAETFQVPNTIIYYRALKYGGYKVTPKKIKIDHGVLK